MRSSRLVSESVSSTLAVVAITFSLVHNCGRGGCFFHQRAERSIVTGRNVGQHLAIQIDARLLQPADELAVGRPGGFAGCADADDPEFPELAFLALSAYIGVLQRFLYRF